MRQFKTSMFGTMDLDNPETYKYLPNTINELRQLMFHKIGFAYCYMNFWHKDVFNKRDGGQKLRVNKLIKYFTDNEQTNYDNIMWYKEQVFLFENETENMC